MTEALQERQTMAQVKSLKDLFIENLRRAYDTEKRLLKALPELRDAAKSEELRHAFVTHFEETEVQIDRLDQIFGWFDEKPKAQTCDGIKGILDDAQRALDLDADAAVADAALIAAAQEAEHFEIALYGTLRSWAAILTKNEALQALEMTLEEETAIDALLTNIAGTLNLRAAHAD
jgi:ferritin-like metal-binding protein YciE